MEDWVYGLVSQDIWYKTKALVGELGDMVEQSSERLDSSWI